MVKPPYVLTKPGSNRADWWMYPDVFDFTFTDAQYQQHWLMLQSPDCYLTLDGLSLKPVPWTAFVWKQFKTGMGYTENNCHPLLIQMAMLKLLYFGYLNGFNLVEKINFSEAFLTKYPLPSDFIKICQQSRKNESSFLLQKALVEFYTDHGAVLRGANLLMPLEAPAHFGESYINQDEKDLNTFAKLDPQNLAPNVCFEMKYQHTLPESTLRELLIQKNMAKLLVNMDQLPSNTNNNFYSDALAGLKHDAEHLLNLCPSLSSSNSDFFIRLYVLLAERRERVLGPGTDYYNKAYAIIKKLDKDIAVPYLKKYFINNANAWAIIEKNDELLIKGFESMYSDVVMDTENIDSKLIGYRILKEKPMLIKDEHLNLFISMALENDAHADALVLIERLHLINQDSAFHYLDHTPELQRALIAGSELANFFAERIAFQSTLTHKFFKLYKEPSLALTKSMVFALAKHFDPDIENHLEMAASFKFGELVNNKKWEAARIFFEKRQKNSLSVAQFKLQDTISAAEYFYNQAREFANKASIIALDSEKNHYKSIDSLIAAKLFHDTQEYRFQLNQQCRLLMELILNQQSKSQKKYDEAHELLNLINENPCNEKDNDLERCLVKLKTYFKSGKDLFNTTEVEFEAAGEREFTPKV